MKKMSYRCYNCNKKFTNIGRHWKNGTCDYPSLSKYHHELITGLVMGDGYISNSFTTPNLVVSMIRPTFLKWLQDELEPLLSKFTHQLTPEQGHKTIQANFGNATSPDNYNDVYRISTLSHPSLNKYYMWYDDGKKEFPDDLKLTPTITKMWYISDGGISWAGDTTASIQIISKNESHREDYLKNLFSDIGIKCQITDGHITFRKEESKNLLKYMGRAPPGFEYKWEINDRERYHLLKEGENYESQRRKWCNIFAEKLNLPQKLSTETYDCIKNIDIDKFGTYTIKQVCFVCVCYIANQNNIFIQDTNEYRELADDILSYKGRITIRKRVREII